MEEIRQQLKMLEGELNGKDFFGGETIGYVDIVANVIAFWFPVTQEVTGEKLLTEEKFPALSKWIEKLKSIDIVNTCIPPREKHLAHDKARFDALKLNSAPK
ncbi:hypothetical protein Pint_32678 [Pistacia integerrima]|uniref:Uncharacterized protein n=1 Tax=Pistacia integerrima TaxID=434235 RepID=A0ACC0XR92_9ROSI|nr:hypothetical protein Pint_32678 [Pistacia integerrima]